MSALLPTPFRRLIDQVMPAARGSIAAVWPSVAAPVVFANVLLILAQRQMMSSLVPGSSQSVPLGFLGFFATLLLVSTFFVITFMVVSKTAMDAVDGKPVDVRRAWLFTLQPRVLLTLLLWLIATSLSLVLCFFPALVVVPLLGLTMQVVAAEERFGWSALKRSASLAWENPSGRLADSCMLRIIALMFVGFVIQMGFSMLAQGPFMALQQYFALRDAAGGVTDPLAAMGPLWVQLGGQILGSLASVFAWFYWAFGFALLYRETRRRREGEDLRQAIQQMTAPAFAES